VRCEPSEKSNRCDCLVDSKRRIVRILLASDCTVSTLRVCWEKATVPETAQRNGNKHHPHEQALVSPELVANLLDPAVAPSTDERCGLEQFLQSQEQVREEQYAVFRQHWYALQARDFKREILEQMETYMSRKHQQEG
jgi:hypothetical protein